MQLIADSGATKTSWRLAQAFGRTKEMSTIGYNPHYFTTDKIVDSLTESLLPQMENINLNEVKEIHFYGAGCSTPNSCKIVEDAFAELFKKAQINIEHDLLAAARASCGREAGIACILGTGSNTCLFDGKKIVDNVPSLGFILGDEGSGAELGRQLVKAYFYRELPPDLEAAFQKEFQLDKEGLYANVYKSGLPSRYMASFTRFLGEHLHHPFAYLLVKKVFNEFFNRMVLKYDKAHELPINFVGSIAFYFRNVLDEVAQEKGLTIGKIVRAPIEALVEFHAK